jgi:hypothetical protein
MAIKFLYQQRPDGTYVIEHNGMPYHVVESDPLYAQCEAEYTTDADYPDEPPPPSPPTVLEADAP